MIRLLAGTVRVRGLMGKTRSSEFGAKGEKI